MPSARSSAITWPRVIPSRPPSATAGVQHAAAGDEEHVVGGALGDLAGGVQQQRLVGAAGARLGRGEHGGQVVERLDLRRHAVGGRAPQARRDHVDAALVELGRVELERGDDQDHRRALAGVRRRRRAARGRGSRSGAGSRRRRRTARSPRRTAAASSSSVARDLERRQRAESRRRRRCSPSRNGVAA